MSLKKTYLTIVILISLSLFGLIFLQFYWIQNAILVQNGKFNVDVENALNNIKSGLKTRVALMLGYNPASIDWSTESPATKKILWSTISKIPTKDIDSLVSRELKMNSIHLPYEFGIVHEGDLLNNTDNFEENLLSKSYQVVLSYDSDFSFFLFIDVPSNVIIRKTFWLIAISIIFTIIIILAFIITVRTIYKQKYLSEIKSDFINNMTHEFKTPLATISLAVDALGYEKVYSKPEQIRYYTRILKEENDRMYKQVEKILTTAKIDSNAMELSIQDVDIHQIIEKAAQSAQMIIEGQGGGVYLKLNANQYVVKGDEVHLTNIINNLIDNAIKYSKTPCNINISTKNNMKNKSICIRVADNGIGMSKESLKHVFEKFYRVPTGNLHNVKGFGLGLSYVKAIVEAHSGIITVESSLGKGSTFKIDLPL